MSGKTFTEAEVTDIVNEITFMVDDLGWDRQRMSSSGKQTYDKLIEFLDKL